jgi:hypothetical protein
VFIGHFALGFAAKRAAPRASLAVLFGAAQFADLGGPKVGLGLWASVPATVAIETAMFVAGVWVYASCTRARDRVGRWGLVGLTALFALAYVGNLTSPPPPSVNALIVIAIIGASVTMVLSWWVDHRESTCHTR